MAGRADRAAGSSRAEREILGLCRPSCDPVRTVCTSCSHEPNEPPHVHVDRDDQSAKFWLKPIALALNLGFSPVELRRIQRMLKENETILLEKWNARFGN